MNDFAIQAYSLRKRFGSKVAVEDLSLAIPAGQVFGFLGPNGAGKTTSLKLLLGLIEPSSGRGSVLGAPIGDRATRARIGFLPEHFHFHDTLTGRELLRIHGRLYALRGAGLDARVEALLERVGLAEAAGRRISTYSKGMVQRIGLAQALINEPALVFLDEPTSGLDPLGRLLVRDIINDLRESGAAVFLNSHLLGEVEATCDRVAFVKDGVVVHELELDESAETFGVEIRLGTADSVETGGLERFGTDVRSDGQWLRLTVAGDEVLPELSAWLVASGAKLYEIRARRKSLEQWFVEVMGEDQGPG